MTFHAPACRSRSICSTHTYGAMMKSASLLPTSATPGTPPGEPLDELPLDVGIERERPVGDLDVAQPELAQPRDQPVDPPLPDRELGPRAAQTHGGAARRVALELGREVARH